MPGEAKAHEKRLTKWEFLKYTWASSMILFMAGSGGALGPTLFSADLGARDDDSSGRP